MTERPTTFTALASQALAPGASQITVENWVRAEMLSKAELLALLEKDYGIALKPVTLDYYVKIGLVPRPLASWKRVGKGRDSFFPPSTVATILAAKKAQDAGRTLRYFQENMVRVPGVLASDTGENWTSIDDLLVGRFVNLSILLIDNLPGINTISLDEYLDIEFTDDFRSSVLLEDLDKIQSYCRHGVSLLADFLDGDYDRVVILQEGNEDLPVVFLSATKEIFRAEAQALYFRYTQDMPPNEKFKVANLERGQYRLEVVLAYIKAAEAAENVARQVFQARQSDASFNRSGE